MPWDYYLEHWQTWSGPWNSTPSPGIKNGDRVWRCGYNIIQSVLCTSSPSDEPHPQSRLLLRYRKYSAKPVITQSCIQCHTSSHVSAKLHVCMYRTPRFCRSYPSNAPRIKITIWEDDVWSRRNTYRRDDKVPALQYSVTYKLMDHGSLASQPPLMLFVVEGLARETRLMDGENKNWYRLHTLACIWPIANSLFPQYCVFIQSGLYPTPHLSLQ